MPWKPEEKDSVVKALAVVCELTGTQFSAAAQAVILRQLGTYQPKQVIAALERCSVECRGRLSLADVVSRLDDGRPGAEEAWASFPKEESDAGCVTQEMSAAWGACHKLYEDGDHVGARMAFKEAYAREVTKGRASSQSPVWRVSPGFDKASTEAAAIEGLRKRLLTTGAALQYIAPENHENALFLAGAGPKPKLLPAANTQNLQDVKKLVAAITDKLGGSP